MNTLKVTGIVVASLFAVGVVGAVAPDLLGGPYAGVSQTERETPGSTPEEEVPEPQKADPDDDLTRLEIVDHKWGAVDYTVTNHSSKPSDYRIRADIVDGDTRIVPLYVYVGNLKPGQTQHGEIHALEFNIPESAVIDNVVIIRTRSWAG